MKLSLRPSHSGTENCNGPSRIAFISFGEFSFKSTKNGSIEYGCRITHVTYSWTESHSHTMQNGNWPGQFLLTGFGGGSGASIAGSGASSGELDIVAVFGVLVAARVVVFALLVRLSP